MNEKVINVSVVEGITLKISVPESLLDALNCTSDRKEIQCDLSHDLSQSLVHVLRKSLPMEDRPPTIKQINYAKSIGGDLMVSVDKDCERYQSVCEAFIDRYAEHHELFLRFRRHVHGLISERLSEARCIKKGLDVIECKKKGFSEKEALNALNVKRVDTLRKYYNCYKNFYERINGEDVCQSDAMIMVIIEQWNKGEDPVSHYAWKLAEKNSPYNDYRVFSSSSSILELS